MVTGRGGFDMNELSKVGVLQENINLLKRYRDIYGTRLGGRAVRTLDNIIASLERTVVEECAMNMDVLIESWTKDIRAFAETRVQRASNFFYGDFAGDVTIKRDKPGQVTRITQAYEEAIALEINWLTTGVKTDEVH